MEKLKVALFGHGHLGKWHLDKLITSPGVDVIGVVDPSEQRIWEIGERHPSIPCMQDSYDVIDKMDVAFIVTPTSTHYTLIRDFIERGVHIFCEKPLVNTQKEANSLMAFARQQEKLGKKLPVIQVGHSERMHQVWEHLDDLPQFFEESGLVRINRMAPFKGRACDVDVISDLMIHDLDLLLYLFKEYPISVQSWGFRSISDHWDTVSSTLHFLSGRVANITVSRNHIVEKREFEIFNESGTLMIDLLNRQVCYTDKHSEDSDKMVRFDYPARDHLLLEQVNFFQAVKNGTKPMVDLAQGVAAIRLSESVRKSLDLEEKLDLTIESKPVAIKSEE